jgi:hypothetical protein
MTRPSTVPRSGLQLLDLTALVAGYGLASLLVRAYWPSAGMAGTGEAAALALVFLWLGLAMSGPVVLLLPRRGVPASGTAPEPDPRTSPEPRTWAEMAWLVIGFYWIGLTVLVVPARLAQTRLLDTAVLGVFPVLAALALRVFGRRRFGLRPTGPHWTHHAAVGLLATWPVVWIALILLGKTFL